jgi:hypothetical protein
VSSNLFAPQMPGPAEVKTSEVILLARKFCWTVNSSCGTSCFFNYHLT